MKQIWNLSIEDVLKLKKASLTEGLSEEEAKQRLKNFGLNELEDTGGRSSLIIFFEQFKDFIIWVLFSAALISGFLNEWVDAIVIFAIIILNALFGFVQEYRAEKSLSALKKLSSTQAKTLRDKQYIIIPSSKLVPGDIVKLESGDKVPADSRIAWQSSNFRVQESTITGESLPIAKNASTINETKISIREASNMVLMGTTVVSGKATVIVVDTGMNTEIGKTGKIIKDIKKETTPLQKKLEEFSKKIVFVCFFLVLIVFTLQWLRGGNLADIFLTSVSLAVAAIPEGLPAVVTIVLALSVQRMIKRNVLIRKLPSVETLGCTTVICSDKTGTLTKDEMTVRTIFVDDTTFNITGAGYQPEGKYELNESEIDLKNYPYLKELLQTSVLCNNAELFKDNNTYKVNGDPTEAALLTAAAKVGLWKKTLEEEFIFLDEFPFDSERKKMTVIRKSKKDGGNIFLFTKGAVEELIKDCNFIVKDGQIRDITEIDINNIIEKNNQFTDKAMRVLAIAYKEIENIPNNYNATSLETGLTLIGLIAMIDPPRLEAKLSIAKCKQAGIRTVMITGDHKNTALAIAKELNILEKDSIALTGEELNSYDEATLLNRIKDVSVYARVSAGHKLRIVRAWRKAGEVVAMTGDGINDAPAVKQADIGVAMGITGTDVTKEVSDMVIRDDNFASIVAAVEEGRGIYDNIKKFVHYLLSCNTGEILVMLVAALVGLPIPLLPIHILWINLVTDGLPALALGMEPIDKSIMSRSPRNPEVSIISKKMAILILIQGVFISLCVLLAFTFILFVEKGSVGRARTGAFVVLACSQLFHSFNCQSLTKSIFKLGIFSNTKLILATLASFLLQIGAVSIPKAQKIFKTEPLGTLDWFIVLLISTFPLFAMEISKYILEKKKISFE
jgi:Ca2+-transporting ATPase